MTDILERLSEPETIWRTPMPTLDEQIAQAAADEWDAEIEGEKNFIAMRQAILASLRELQELKKGDDAAAEIRRLREQVREWRKLTSQSDNDLYKALCEVEKLRTQVRKLRKKADAY